MYYLFFYDFETTQDTNVSYSATLHVPNLVCLQQFRTLCEMTSDINEDCVRCGKRELSFWDAPVGELLSYLRTSAMGQQVRGICA